MIISATYANAEHTAAVVGYEGEGPRLVSRDDEPALWTELLAWGTPEAYIAPQVEQHIEWGALIRGLTAEEAEQFDAAVQAAPARFRWLIQKTAYISTTDPDYPTLKAAFDAAYGQPRSDELLPPVGATTPIE